MGAYIRFKLTGSVDESPKEINNWLNSQPEQEELKTIEHGPQVRFWDRLDQEWWENEHGTNYHLDIGEGNIKASCTPPEAKELWGELFEKLHTEYDVIVLGSSCGLTLDHLTRRQLRQITNNGNAISNAQ